VCALMLAVALCARAIAVLPAESAAALLELAAFAQLVICVAGFAAFVRPHRTEEPRDLAGPSSDPYQ
jgi:hypothetical protein